MWAKVYACSAFAQPHFKLFFEKKQEFGLEPFFASSGQIQSGDFSRLPHRLRQAMLADGSRKFNDEPATVVAEPSASIACLSR